MKKKLLLLAADFYPRLTEKLIAGAHAALGEDGGGFIVEEERVGGALELPSALNFAADSYDGYIVLGCIIRGETTHYQLVVERCSEGVSKVALEHNLAVGFGVITAADHSQAERRALPPPGRNLGFSAAKACLQLLVLKDKFSK